MTEYENFDFNLLINYDFQKHNDKIILQNFEYINKLIKRELRIKKIESILKEEDTNK